MHIHIYIHVCNIIYQTSFLGQDLIVKLMEEANEESEHKGWCDTELSTNEKTRKEKTEALETTDTTTNNKQQTTHTQNKHNKQTQTHYHIYIYKHS